MPPASVHEQCWQLLLLQKTVNNPLSLGAYDSNENICSFSTSALCHVLAPRMVADHHIENISEHFCKFICCARAIDGAEPRSQMRQKASGRLSSICAGPCRQVAAAR